MSLWGVQIIENASVPLDEVMAIMPLGGTFPLPEGWHDMSKLDRFRYAVEQGAIIVVNPASNPWRNQPSDRSI